MRPATVGTETSCEKLTLILVLNASGLPCTTTGVYRHCATALAAASARVVAPSTISAFVTRPLVSTVASITTTPVSPARDAAAG